MTTEATSPSSCILYVHTILCVSIAIAPWNMLGVGVVLVFILNSIVLGYVFNQS